MSGPKVSIYELRAAEKALFYEQRKVANQITACEQRILNSLKTLSTELDNVLKLISEGEAHCQNKNRSLDVGDIKAQIEQIQAFVKDLTSEYQNINNKYAVDKTGYISLAHSMIVERKNKLKDFTELEDSIGNRIRETRGLRGKVLDAILEVDESIRNELIDQMLGGFSLDITKVKRKIEAKSVETESEVNQEEVAKKLSEISRKIYDALENVIEEIGSVDNLSPSLKAKLKQLQEKSVEITSVDFLENYYAISVVPFVKEAVEYSKLRNDYDILYGRYARLCEEAGIAATALDCSEAGLSLLREQIERIERENAECMKREYINNAIEEAMIEMGYNLVGHREAVKKTGKRIKHELYQFEEGTGVDVTYGENGQITMELGGFDNEDRVPNASEAGKLTEDMHKFCGEYAALERVLEKKGVERKNVSMMPAKEEFAQIINTNEYELVKGVQVFQVRKEKKNELKENQVQ